MIRKLLLNRVLKTWDKVLYEEAEHGFPSHEAYVARKKWVFARTVYRIMYHDYYPERLRKEAE